MTEPAAPSPVPGRPKRLVPALAVVLPVALLFGVLEGGARVREVWVPPLVVDLGQGFDPSSRLFVPDPADPSMMVTNPEKTVSFQKQRFARGKPPRTLRVFALGGSSVNYLDYEFPLLAERLQKALADRYDRAEIINCGGLSYGSHRLVLVAGEIINYAPDLVMVYSGHNEFEELQQLRLSGVEVSRAQRVLSRSALYRLLRDFRARRAIAALEEARAQRDLAVSLPDASKTWDYRFTPEEVAGRMQAYRENLAAILRLCRGHGVPVVIGTVPSNLVKPSLPGPDGQRYEAEVLPLLAAGDFTAAAEKGAAILREASPRHQSSGLENGILRALAAEHGVPLADVEAAVIAAEPHGVPGETLFNDHCHLNPAGNALLVRVYEKEILRALGAGE